MFKKAEISKWKYIAEGCPWFRVFSFWNFGFVSDFEIRSSSFPLGGAVRHARAGRRPNHTRSWIVSPNDGEEENRWERATDS
jgi:hypothetical protein